ncbi:hypothetical protein HNR39_000423 [Glaciimonas immobilis]|uniref:Uncharacterized protein n=1 Tax=Glaciimonas immobilis TaxID=728004 RepID=A0A840RLI1_9BURK|nr:hypothetical protein [Glaciimonas immobilis]
MQSITADVEHLACTLFQRNVALAKDERHWPDLIG